MSLEPIDDLTLKDRVIRRLRRAILAGSLPAGAPLSERDIAAQLGVSRTPVREAFAALGREGLLTLSPHREVRVAALSPAQQAEVCRLRALLESYALGLALRGRPAALLQTLGEIVAGFQSLAQSELPADGVEAVLEQGWRLDMRFHEAIVQAAGDSMLQQVWETRGALVWMPATPRRFAEPAEARALLRRQYQEHAALLAAISAGAVRPALRLLAAHLLQAAGLELTATSPDLLIGLTELASSPSNREE